MFYNWTVKDNFWLSTLYGSVSILLAIIILVIIFKNSKTFDSSFFQLYTYDSILNIFLHFVNWFSMRLSLMACKDCGLGAFYAGLKHRFLLNFMIAMRYHMAYVQYSIIAVVSLNRLSVLFDLIFYERHWKRYGFLVFAAIVILPLISTHTIFFCNPEFKYDATDDIYLLESDLVVADIYELLIPFLGGSLLVSLVANIWSFIIVRSRTTQSRRRAEINFLVIMSITCIIELVGTIISYCLYYFATGMNSDLLTNFKLALPYVSDALTLVQPWLLLFFSHAVREKLFQLLHITRPVNAVMFKPSSITHVT